MSLKNKKILLIVGGGISAYKCLDLIRLLKKSEVEIKTILTQSGKEFVTPLSIASLTSNKVFENIFDVNNESEIDHISLSRWADMILVIPTTANFMAKLSVGKAEDLATTTILASNKEILLVPAMNVRMWLHKATQENVKTLLDFGYRFIGPTEGEMACGEYGEGKMSSPRQIITYLKNYFESKNLVQKKGISALVTTGPTKEYLDPVRYISNESSGKQGHEIAIALSKLGIKTTIIAGPSKINFSKNIKVHSVTSAEQMFVMVKKLLPVDIAVCAAAVSDYRPLIVNKKKLKKHGNLYKLDLKKNPDILEYLGKNNKMRPKLVVGFSAETNNLIKNSSQKLKDKHCDIIIANDVSKNDVGFNVDYNRVSIINKNGKINSIKKSKKSFIASVVAQGILDELLLYDKNIN
tara:strand:+ start:4521 stop:5747 length:1227 start_codon:yes stop_codon:yes gene_type:complete